MMYGMVQFPKGTTDNIKYIYKDQVVQTYQQAIQNMYADASVKADISSIKQIQSDIEQLYKDTENAPDELKEVRSAASDFITAFNDRMNFQQRHLVRYHHMQRLMQIRNLHIIAN